MKKFLSWSLLLLSLILLSSDFALAEDFKKHDLGYVNLKDNEHSFMIENVKNEPVTVKFSIIDTYDLVDVTFEKTRTEIAPKSTARINFTFDLNKRLRTSGSNNTEHTFQIIPNILNTADNSVIMVTETSNPSLTPKSFIFNFKYEGDDGFFSSSMHYLSENIINILVIVMLFGFFVYIGFEIYTFFRTRKNYSFVKKDNGPISRHKTSDVGSKKNTLVSSFMKSLPSLKKRKSAKSSPQVKKDQHDKDAAENHEKRSDVEDITEKEDKDKKEISEKTDAMKKDLSSGETKKSHSHESGKQQQKEPKTYEEFIEHFVEEHKGSWDDSDFFSLLSRLSQNKFKKKINEIQHDLEKEKTRFEERKKDRSGNSGKASSQKKDGEEEKKDVKERTDDKENDNAKNEKHETKKSEDVETKSKHNLDAVSDETKDSDNATDKKKVSKEEPKSDGAVDKEETDEEDDFLSDIRKTLDDIKSMK